MSKDSKKGASSSILEKKLNDALDRIQYLETKIEGSHSSHKDSDQNIFLKAVRSELMTKVEDRTKEIYTRQEEIEETKVGLEKRIKQLERKFKSISDELDSKTEELRMQIEGFHGHSEPLQNTQELDKKLKQMDQKRKRDTQDMHDDVMDIIEQKLLLIQKERASKVDRMQKELNETVKRLDVHDDDLIEMTKVIKELDRDRIQDGKATQMLKQEYDILDERLDNMAEAILEINSVVNKNARITVDQNDLNVIKEACLQDFDTLNGRINDVCEMLENVGMNHINYFFIGSLAERNEKEIDAIKMIKQPKLNMARKDISSPLRSSMSQHLGSNLNKRRSDSQTELNRMENIQKLTDQDAFLRVDRRTLPERESVLSNSKINKYLSESFDEIPDANFHSNPDKVIVFEKSSRGRSQEKDPNRFQKLSRNMRRSSPGEEVIVEDIDSYEDTDRKENKAENIRKNQQTSSKKSEYTFKADEIINDRSEQESGRQKKEIIKKKEEVKTMHKREEIIDLRENSNQTKQVWRNGENKDILVDQKKQISQNVAKRDSSPMPYKVQLGPVGGDTLDEESSEEEDFESEFSMQNNQYFQAHADNLKHEQPDSKMKSRYSFLL
jgi:DNA-binding ferritin-like protein